MHEDFVYAVLRRLFNEKFNYYANRMERQWHEVFYKKLKEKENIPKVKDFICPIDGIAWHRFLTQVYCGSIGD